MNAALPEHYRSTIRTLIRYSIVLLALGLLSGVAFQESSKKLDYAEIAAGARLEAVLSLALVHGHMLVTGVLMPLALAAALDLAHRSGGAELSVRSLRWLTRGYLPCVSATLALMLYKGYHTLLSVRFGARDFDAIDANYFGGLVWLRHGVYGLSHIAMSLSLGVFVVAIWRSLRRS